MGFVKAKRKLITIIFSLILALYPIAVPVTFVHAEISLPGSPDSPDDPNSPNPPGEENTTSVVGTSSTSEPTSDGGFVNSSNTNTGSDSTNDSDTSINNDTDINIDSSADIDNLADVDAVTGNNTADENTGNGNVSTGDASIIGDVETQANSLNIGALECSTECGVISLESLGSANSNTGSGSENDASSQLNNTNSLDINNGADLDNYLMFDADSGTNSASKNTGDGIITTGDSEIILTAINTANNINVGYDVFNIYDDQTTDLVIDFNNLSDGSPYVSSGVSSSNDTTGSDSTNSASSSESNTNTILIDNYGNVINNYDLDANTGGNSADKNTGDGSIVTGDANVVFNLLNFLNNVFLGGGGELLLGVVNIFGNMSGDIVLQGINSGTASIPFAGGALASNTTTGSDSVNSADSSQDNDTNITLGNAAEILNNVTLDANTGNNSASMNTGSGFITTGDSDASLKVTNIVNNTSIGSGGDVWMVLINNLGVWTGQLFGADSSTGVYSPFFTFTINPDGTISAENQNTGSDSNNTASSSTDNDTDITVNNTGNLVNNVYIDANTGGNSASRNTGSGTVRTGDANITANILNMINNTFLGGRFLLTIVNIFGSFTGDIGPAGVGGISVGTNDSLAISQNRVTNSSNYAGSNWGLYQNGLGALQVGQSDSGNDENNDSLLLVAGKNIADNFTPITRFGADRGLLDGFRLEYLLIPVILGTLLSIFRRVVVRR